MTIDENTAIWLFSYVLTQTRSLFQRLDFQETRKGGG